MKRNKDSRSYIKFLAVIDTIQKHSDQEHALSVKDIQNHVYERFDFSLDRRLIKKYIHDYNEYFEDNCIEYYKDGRNNYYYYNETVLDMMEAKAIVDLVYSSDFFTLKTKDNYKKRIQSMFSPSYHAYFDKILNTHITKNENDQVFYQELETITKAIHTKKKIRFFYQKKNKVVELAPIDTYFSNNEYYLLCQGAKNPNDCLSYRLDHIQNVEIVDDSSVSFDNHQLKNYQEALMNSSNMYSQGNIEIIELDFHQDIYSNIIDKFGKDIKPYQIDKEHYRLQVKHKINSTFYAWVIGFGGKIKISGDETQVKKFHHFLNEHFLDLKGKE